MFLLFFKAGLVILSPEWNRILVNRNKKEREKTPLSHLCYCKQRAGGERIRLWGFEFIL